MNARLLILGLWASLLVGALTWPFFAAGELAWRDMLVLDSPALSPSAFGFGDLPARNAPQDGVLAILGVLFPASWIVRVLLIGGAAAAAYAGALLAHERSTSLPAQLTAMTIAVANPFVVERLLQGQWSLVLAAWLLPVIVALRTRLVWVLVAVLLSSLTPTGALFATLTALFVVRDWCSRVLTLVVAGLASLPWLVPSLQDIPHAATSSYFAFGPRAETYVGTLGSLLGLGGIWNGQAVPASRSAGFAIFGVVLFAVLWLGRRAVPRAVLALAVLGLGGALVGWLAPELLSAVDPGVLRDSQKLVMLAIPAYCCAAAGVPRLWAYLALLCAVLQVIDAPAEVSVLAPREVTAGLDQDLLQRADGRTVFLPDAPTVVSAPGWVSINPYTKALPVVYSGELEVDGALVDKPSRRYILAQQAWEAGDHEHLRNLGIGVVYAGGVITETGAGPEPVPWGWHAGWFVAWLLVLWWQLRNRTARKARKTRKTHKAQKTRKAEKTRR